MEMLEGETLAARLEQGALPLAQALTVAIQIASALDKAHRADITHRDLKPGNIMLTKAGAKLLDFGLAKSGGSVFASGRQSMLPTTPPNLTAQGTILGTFQYMAPEQLEGREADARSDLFAFGAVLYEMVTGRKAFEGRSQASLIAAILKDQPLPIDAAQPLAPSALDRLVRTCLAKDPDQRWQNAGDLTRELQWVATGDSTTVGAARPVERHHAREYVAWSLATLATIVAMGALLLHSRTPRPAETVVRFTVAPPPGGIRAASSRFAVTQDGHVLAFVAKAADGVFRIFIRRVDAAEAAALAGTDNATAVFWSPGGQSVAFERDGGLYRVDLDGSTPRRLCDVPGRLFRGGSWGSRGVIVFGSATGLLRVPDTGGPPSPVTTLDSEAKEVTHAEPWFLPDGRHLLFVALGKTQASGVIWAASIDDSSRRRLVDSIGGAAYAAGWLLSTTLRRVVWWPSRSIRTT
jgi:hypothetical protein